MPLTQLASMMNVFQSGIASLERVLEFLDAEEQSARPGRRRRRRRRCGAGSSSDDVTFSYDPDRPLIESLSLVAEPGQTIAIVGPDRRRQDHARQPHHAVLRARRRRRSPSTAATSRRSRATSCARKIGMVLQDTWLFGGTIRDNIAYGNPDATEERDPRGGPGHLRRPLRALAARRLRHGDQRRGRQHQRRPEAAAHHRPRLPRRPRRSSSSTRPPARSTPAPRCRSRRR